jgi:preprotein translocase subunit SecB
MTDQPQNQQPQFIIQRLYLKDASFEAPNAPAIFREEWRPENQLNLNTTVNPLDATTFEVVLTVTLTVKAEEGRTAYVAEVHQAGIFTLSGFPEQDMAPMFGIHCPHILFPYAREVIADLIAKGSFPQMILQPVNFEALFVQHQQELAKQAAPTGHSLN